MMRRGERAISAGVRAPLCGGAAHAVLVVRCGVGLWV